MANYNYRRIQWSDQEQLPAPQQRAQIPLTGNGKRTTRQQAADLVLHHQDKPRRFLHHSRLPIIRHPVHPQFRISLLRNLQKPPGSQIQHLPKRAGGIALPTGHSRQIGKADVHPPIRFPPLFPGSPALFSRKAPPQEPNPLLAGGKAANLKKRACRMTKMLTT